MRMFAASDIVTLSWFFGLMAFMFVGMIIFVRRQNLKKADMAPIPEPVEATVAPEKPNGRPVKLTDILRPGDHFHVSTPAITNIGYGTHAVIVVASNPWNDYQLVDMSSVDYDGPLTMEEWVYRPTKDMATDIISHRIIKRADMPTEFDPDRGLLDPDDRSKGLRASSGKDFLERVSDETPLVEPK